MTNRRHPCGQQPSSSATRLLPERRRQATPNNKMMTNHSSRCHPCDEQQQQQPSSSSTRLLPPKRRQATPSSPSSSPPSPPSSLSSFSCRNALVRAVLLSTVFVVWMSQRHQEAETGTSSSSSLLSSLQQLLLPTRGTTSSVGSSGGSGSGSSSSSSSFGGPFWKTGGENDSRGIKQQQNQQQRRQQHQQHLQQLLQTSAFDGRLYHSFRSPYADWECQPRKVHLAQRSDVDPVTSRVGMTVSFTLHAAAFAVSGGGGGSNGNGNNSSNDSDDDVCRSVQVTVVYGRGFFPEGRSGSATDVGGDGSGGGGGGSNSSGNTTDPDTDYDDDDEVVQFKHYTSPVTGEDYTSDYIHHVILPELVAGRQKYWYRIVVQRQPRRQPQTTTPPPPFVFPPVSFPDGAATNPSAPYRSLRGSYRTVGETPVYYFQTPPLYHQPTSLALVGDLGQTENSTKTMNRIYQAMMMSVSSSSSSSSSSMMPVPPVTALLIAGDLSYADGDPHRWESWLEVMEPLLRSLPLAAAVGNHEIECDNITREVFVPYESYFRNPNRIHAGEIVPPTDEYVKTQLWNSRCNAPSAFLGHYDYGNAFYHFTHGLVHVIVLNSYTSSVKESVQHTWLKTVAFPAVDRTLTPWLLVMFHCPLYTTFLGHEKEINPTLMLANMEDLFLSYKVNLIVSGHDHAYMRTKPMHEGKSVSGGLSAPSYWTLGAGGNREQHSRGYIHNVTPEEWVAYRNNDDYGYGHLYVANSTHARLTWMRDDDGTTTTADNNNNNGNDDDVWMENYYFL